MPLIDPDLITDRLGVVVNHLLADDRTVSLALRLGDLRREIAAALAAPPRPRRVDPGPDERARQARLQGCRHDVPPRDLAGEVFRYGGRHAAERAGR